MICPVGYTTVLLGFFSGSNSFQEAHNQAISYQSNNGKINMKRLFTPIAVIATCMVTLSSPTAIAADSDTKKAVLVTGSSSGIGLKTTETLSANGFYVYAGARKAADLERLDAMENVSAVRLDVTVQNDIDAAVQLVKDQGRGLYGIVNNAGVSAFSPLTTGPESDMDFVFDVNVYGPYRINKAFLPLLEESGGHTTLIGSISGFFGTSGIYSMSKFAVEAYTDSLAREIEDSGIHVSIVEPGGYRSSIGVSRGARALAAADKGEIQLTAQQRARFEDEEARRADRKEPDEVADAILDLLTTDNPKRRYMITPNERQAHGTVKAAMRRAVQLNYDQPYAQDREGLIAVLDELIEEVSSD